MFLLCLMVFLYLDIALGEYLWFFCYTWFDVRRFTLHRVSKLYNNRCGNINVKNEMFHTLFVNINWFLYLRVGLYCVMKMKQYLIWMQCNCCIWIPALQSRQQNSIFCCFVLFLLLCKYLDNVDYRWIWLKRTETFLKVGQF